MDQRVFQQVETAEVAVMVRKREKGGKKVLGVAKRKLKGLLPGEDYGDRKVRALAAENLALADMAAAGAREAEEWLLPAEAGFLEPEGEMERTYRVQQVDVVRAVDANTRRKAMDLSLPQHGPYSVAATSSGRHVVLAGKKGHLAVMDWSRGHIACELEVGETTRHALFLHNEGFFAAAQKKYCYIYDKRGLEVHCLKEHTNVRTMSFLKKFFLLASVGDAGVLRYQDTSTGVLVATHRTKLGRCNAMRENPFNSVLHLGHHNGTVTMWSPSSSSPLVRLLCHRGPVSSIAIDGTGQYMATAGADLQIKIWDLRTFKPLHAYFSRAAPTSIDISQRGLLSVAYGASVQIWKDALGTKQASPYMTHRFPGAVEVGTFCPYEDALLCGHSDGFSTMIVPGAGEPNFDSMIANPFQTRKQRREAEVHQVLDKLPPDMIVLDPEQIGKVRITPREEQQALKEKAEEARRAHLTEQRGKNEKKTKVKGKNKPTRRNRKRQINVYDDKRAAVDAKREDREKREREHKEAALRKEEAKALPLALQRFAR